MNGPSCIGKCSLHFSTEEISFSCEWLCKCIYTSYVHIFYMYIHVRIIVSCTSSFSFKACDLITSFNDSTSGCDSLENWILRSPNTEFRDESNCFRLSFFSES